MNFKETNLTLSPSNRIEGIIVIHGPFDIFPAEDIKTLMEFKVSQDKNNNVSIKIPISGMRL